MFNTQAFRKSVLNQALQGNLTQQLPEDGDAVDLLQSITKEKQHLYQAGKIRKPKQLTAITDDEMPFKVPDNWQWIRLNDVGTWKSGSTPRRNHPEYYNGNIPWITIHDLNDNYLYHSNEQITQKGFNNSSMNINHKGNILLAMYGSVGKLGILNINAVTNQAVCACHPFSYINNKFLFYYLMSQRKGFINLSAGGVQKNISRTKIIHYSFPLPPLSEQKRIVKNIDECFKLADLIDQEQKLTKDFDDDMYKSLLQAAMQGKLTQQLPEDGNAADLLHSIAEKKQRLYKAGKIKKPKQLAAITDDEIPFKIPDNWKWVRINNLFIEGPQKRPDKKSLYINVKGIKNNKITNLRLINQDNAPSRARKIVYKGDLIYSTVRPYLHNVAIINKNHNHELFASTAFVVMKLFINNKYMKYITLSNLFDKQVNKLATGTTYPAINNTNFKKIKIPLPPLKEQTRIVSKLDSLLNKMNIR